MFLLLLLLSKTCFILASSSSACEWMTLGPQELDTVDNQNCSHHGSGWFGALNNVEKMTQNGLNKYKLYWSSLVVWPECVGDVKLYINYKSEGYPQIVNESIQQRDYYVIYFTKKNQFNLTIKIYDKPLNSNKCKKVVADIAPLETLYHRALRPEGRVAGGRGLSGGDVSTCQSFLTPILRMLRAKEWTFWFWFGA